MAKAKHPDWMDLNEAVKHVMKATGKTRRQAQAAILQKLKSGEIRAQGIPVGETEPVDIAPAEFLRVPTEH